MEMKLIFLVKDMATKFIFIAKWLSLEESIHFVDRDTPLARKIVFCRQINLSLIKQMYFVMVLMNRYF